LGDGTMCDGCMGGICTSGAVTCSDLTMCIPGVGCI
jgi:hypothetical protein